MEEFYDSAFYSLVSYAAFLSVVTQRRATSRTVITSQSYEERLRRRLSTCSKTFKRGKGTIEPT